MGIYGMGMSDKEDVEVAGLEEGHETVVGRDRARVLFINGTMPSPLLGKIRLTRAWIALRQGNLVSPNRVIWI